jgi:hypothetical protein
MDPGFLPGKRSGGGFIEGGSAARPMANSK